MFFDERSKKQIYGHTTNTLIYKIQTRNPLKLFGRNIPQACRNVPHDPIDKTRIKMKQLTIWIQIYVFPKKNHASNLRNESKYKTAKKHRKNRLFDQSFFSPILIPPTLKPHKTFEEYSILKQKQRKIITQNSIFQKIYTMQKKKNKK